MTRSASRRATETRLLRLALLAATLGLALVLPAHGQVSPEEHAKHHPGAGTASQGNIPPAGPRAGMMGGMGANPPGELYPSLMSLPDLTPEKEAFLMRLVRHVPEPSEIVQEEVPA